MKQNIIRLNGKPYDASTGKPINNSKISAITTSKTNSVASPKTNNPANSRVSQIKKNSSSPVNNSKRPVRSNVRAKYLTTAQKSSRSSHETSQKKLTELKPTTDIKSTHRTPKRATSSLQRTTTLRRSTVKKPVIQTGASVNNLRSTGNATTKLQPTTTISRASSTNPLKTPRKTTAHMRSPLISKFNSRQIDAVPQKITKPIPRKTTTTPSRRKFNDPIIKASPSKKTSAAKKTPVKLSAKEVLIAKKFAELDAKKAIGEQSKPKRKTRLSKHIKISTILAGGIAIVLISAYVVYLSMPNIALKIASRRAGFTASLPHYLPAGFKFENPIQYKSGQVVLTFNSKSDGRSYSLTQQPTQWDSEAVFEDYIKPQSNQPPYTIQNSGLTIYIYGNNNAAWVNGGKFFAINGKDAQLSVQQLQNIATSL